MHVNNSKLGAGGVWQLSDPCPEIEGTRVPDTDQFWGFGEVPQLEQTAMRFGRQVDNIIWE